jgi:hypothetical protein
MLQYVEFAVRENLYHVGTNRQTTPYTMPNTLFNIKYPPYNPDLTFEQFRNQCLQLQFEEKNRNNWIRKVHVKYLIPLVISTPQGMNEYFENVHMSEGVNSMKQNVIRILTKLNPEATGFKVFEMLNKAFPELADTYLKTTYDKIKKVHEDKESERKRLWTCAHSMEEYLKAGNPLKIGLEYGKIRLLSTSDYKFSHPRTGLFVTFRIPHDIDIKPKKAMLHTKYNYQTHKRTYDPSQEPPNVDHYTLRGRSESKEHKNVDHYSAEHPLVIKMKYAPPTTGDKGGSFTPYGGSVHLDIVDNTGKRKPYRSQCLYLKAEAIREDVR